MTEESSSLLTIAVPAYNASATLRRCLDSFCLDAILSRLEVIVVNDGSQDGTSEIAHAYERRYPDVFRVIDKENGGHGSGINTAITRARGKYFQTVDADDWVITENLPKLLSVLERVSADVILCNYHMVDMTSGKKQPFTTAEIPLDREYSIEKFMTYPRNSRNCCFFHGLIYRTAFYRSTGLKLSEKVFYEDQEYATIPFCYAASIYPTGIFCYQYQVGNANQSISNANQVRNLGQIETVLWQICDFYTRHAEGMTQGKRDYFLFKLSTLLLSYYVASLLKDSDRARGLTVARNMHAAVQTRCPDLAAASEKKYRIAMLLHVLHISADTLEKAKTTKLYYAIRKKL